MPIEFESLIDKQESPLEYLPGYDHEDDYLSAQEGLLELEKYEERIKQELMLVQDWKKQLTGWIINAQVTRKI